LRRGLRPGASTSEYQQDNYEARSHALKCRRTHDASKRELRDFMRLIILTEESRRVQRRCFKSFAGIFPVTKSCLMG
jgi:hypothetical protein